MYIKLKSFLITVRYLKKGKFYSDPEFNRYTFTDKQEAMNSFFVLVWYFTDTTIHNLTEE